MSARIEQATHRPSLHALTLAAFALLTAIGYVYAGGLSFVQLWSGSIAAVIATAFLVTKSQGYWFWMVVNSALWFSLFLHEQLPLLAWLQMSFLLMCAYGLARWAVVQRWKIGYFGTRLDNAGVVIAVAVLVWSVVAYWHMPGYALSGAIALDAYRYKLNWVAWTASNAFSAPLFLHGRLWGPFVTLFVYQAINVVGWFVWVREEALVYA
jgi:hypothetical protein